MLAVAGGEHCYRAHVIGAIGIRMDALMQLRGNRKDGRAEKRDDQSAAGEFSPHCAATLPPVLNLRKRFLQTSGDNYRRSVELIGIAGVSFRYFTMTV